MTVKNFKVIKWFFFNKPQFFILLFCNYLVGTFLNFCANILRVGQKLARIIKTIGNKKASIESHRNIKRNLGHIVLLGSSVENIDFFTQRKTLTSREISKMVYSKYVPSLATHIPHLSGNVRMTSQKKISFSEANYESVKFFT